MRIYISTFQIFPGFPIRNYRSIHMPENPAAMEIRFQAAWPAEYSPAACCLETNSHGGQTFYSTNLSP